MRPSPLFAALLLACAATDAAARASEGRIPPRPPRDCITMGYASVDSITTEGLARGRQLAGVGYVHVATLRNHLARPLEVQVSFDVPEASEAARDSIVTLPPRALLRVRLGVTPEHRTAGELRATVSLRCSA